MLIVLFNTFIFNGVVKIGGFRTAIFPHASYLFYSSILLLQPSLRLKDFSSLLFIFVGCLFSFTSFCLMVVLEMIDNT